MLHGILRRDRSTVLAGLVTVIVLAWVYLLAGAGVEMEPMDTGGGQMMMMAPEWNLRYAALIFVMWAIMMMAMMLPSAAPTILLTSALARQQTDRRMTPVWLFSLGYIAVWIAFSLIATTVQWGLDRAGLLSDQMASTSTTLAGAALIAAGVYQWTPLKQSCLRHCRAPLEFVLRYWRRPFGPLQSGVRHGIYCLGCCWVLMGLLFIGGLMNVLWIAAIALLVLIEKTSPWGNRASWLIGVILVVWGAALLATAI
jgi:predicted metal-binding membrane protein